MPPKPDSSAPDAPASFEKGLEQLEQIVRELERGEMSLEESIALFEKGMSLSEMCRKQLEDAETKVEVLRRQGTSRVAGLPESSSPSVPDGSSDDDDSIPF
jgi:exodeoxyribonuclease VII small subunit